MTKAPKKTRKTGKKVLKPYEPTEVEKAAIAKYDGRDKAPRFELQPFDENKKLLAMAPVHADTAIAKKLLQASLGTNSQDFADHTMKQAFSVLGYKPGSIGEEEVNAAVAAIHGIAPRDELEAMLAVQMTATHSVAMKMLERLSLNTETIDQQNSAGNQANKLLRTFTTQMEALNRYRGKGQQKMTVEYIHVHEGGQAIVGNVQGGEGKEKKGEQPHAKAADA